MSSMKMKRGSRVTISSIMMESVRLSANKLFWSMLASQRKQMA